MVKNLNSEKIKKINNIQKYYAKKLAQKILNGSFKIFKEIDFTSETGTGKTYMMAYFMQYMPDDYFFVITSLSKAQLHKQIENKLDEILTIKTKKYAVFGNCDINDAIFLKKRKKISSQIPKNKKIIWIRDEGHIENICWKTYLYDEVKVLYTINFSATNFGNIGLATDTNKFEFMLRRDIKMCGKIEEALNKLLEIKKIHQNVKNYNPCALFRIFNNTMRRNVKKNCKNFNLNYVDLNDRKSNKDIKIVDLCKNNNIYDVIITKNKITEGIDLQRCHVIYFGNYPELNTELQTIGRSKRNALFWKEDFDFFDPKNSQIAEETKKCYIFFNLNAKNKKKRRERLYCDLMSIEKFQKNIDIEVKNGICKNIKRALIRPEIKIRIIELEKKSGKYHISYDQKYNANIVNNEEFYKPKIGIVKQQ